MQNETIATTIDIISAVIIILFLFLLFISSRPKDWTLQLPDRWREGIATTLTRWVGWKIHNITSPTEHPKAVVILAPHTSNWDFFYGILFKYSHPMLSIKFAIKQEVMFFPLSYFMRIWGAIPIDRSKAGANKRQNMVTTITQMFHETDSLLLVIAPEGTRSHAKRWKTGFYRIAESANVPIILGYMNYLTKEIGLGPTFYPTGNIEEDIANIQAFYKKIPGKQPDKGVI